jgi:hypothetical protein
MYFCAVVGIPALAIIVGLRNHAYTPLIKHYKSARTYFSGCASIEKALHVRVVSYSCRERSRSYRVSDGVSDMCERGQAYTLIVFTREFGVSSLKHFCPHLMGLIPHFKSRLVTLQIYHERFQPEVVRLISQY